MSKMIRQSVTFHATAKEVYEALMDSRKHSKFSGQQAVISRKVGGGFTAYGDYISGKNLELVANKRIVQEWRGSDWAEGVHSTVTIGLKAVKAGTLLTFTQSGVPDDQYASIKRGWIEFYWNPMKAMLEG